MTSPKFSRDDRLSIQNKLLSFDCLDLDSPYESREMRCCQYCFHIPDKDIKQSPEKWVCNLPNREDQRRHYANLDNKQKVLTFESGPIEVQERIV